MAKKQNQEVNGETPAQYSACFTNGSPMDDDSIIEQALAIIARRDAEKTFTLTSTALTRSYVKNQVQLELAVKDREVFVCVFLDSQHRVIAKETLFVGTLDGSVVHPREVVRQCIHHNAGAVIFFHNHPSGMAEPSQADISITRRLRQALELIGVRALDHIVVGATDTVSLAERGMM